MMTDQYLGSGPGGAHHRFYVQHLASKFYSKLLDKSLKMLFARAAYERQPYKFKYRMERIVRISQEAHG